MLGEFGPPDALLFGHPPRLCHIAGFCSRQAQNDELRRKEQIYRYNQILAVLLCSKDLIQPNWEELLYSRIERTYRQAFDPMRYISERIEK